MREILFRGKSSHCGWKYGHYIVRDHESQIGCDSMLTFAVNPETVGQFTGLLDKKGTKIFEGDIVKAWSEGLCAVGEVIRRIDGLWIIYPAHQKQIFWGLMPNLKGETSVEVIGNIHDNPELLRNC